MKMKKKLKFWDTDKAGSAHVVLVQMSKKIGNEIFSKQGTALGKSASLFFTPILSAWDCKGP